MTRTIQFSGIFILALLAAIVATFCDAIHVYTKTLSYPNPSFFNQAWWVFPGFFLAFAFMAYSYIQVTQLLKHYVMTQLSCHHDGTAPLVEALVLFAIVYMLSGFGNFYPEALCWIFYISFFIRWLFSYERTWLLILAIMLAIGGMLFEGLLAEFGLVKYRYSEIFNVPYWLGGVYMHGTFALRAGMRRFVYR